MFYCERLFLRLLEILVFCLLDKSFLPDVYDIRYD